MKDILTHIDGIGREEMTKIYKNFNIKNPETGNALSEP